MLSNPAIYYILLIVGFALFIACSTAGFVNAFSKNEKYNKEDYFFHIYIPNLISSILILIGFIGLFNINYDEQYISYVTGITAILGIGLASLAMCFSWLRMTSVAD
jgi:hypothetical protein